VSRVACRDTRFEAKTKKVSTPSVSAVPSFRRRRRLNRTNHIKPQPTGYEKHPPKMPYWTPVGIVMDEPPPGLRCGNK
jgi:hypothetical protein